MTSAALLALIEFAVSLLCTRREVCRFGPELLKLRFISRRMLSSLQSLTYVILYTLLQWLPYICAQFYSNGTASKLWMDGVFKKLGYDDAKLMRVPQPAWAERAAQAHKNSVENLVAFAPLVLMADRAGIDVDIFAFSYLIGRLVHYPAQAIGPMLPAVRTLAFGVAWGSCLLIGYMLII